MMMMLFAGAGLLPAILRRCRGSQMDLLARDEIGLGQHRVWILRGERESGKCMSGKVQSDLELRSSPLTQHQSSVIPKIRSIVPAPVTGSDHEIIQESTSRRRTRQEKYATERLSQRGPEQRTCFTDHCSTTNNKKDVARGNHKYQSAASIRSYKQIDKKLKQESPARKRVAPKVTHPFS